MYRVEVVVEGVGNGLLMHKFSVAATASLEGEVRKAKQKQLTPAEEAEQGAYRLEAKDGAKGQLCLPAEHFLGALTAAGSSLKVRGSGKSTYKKAFAGHLDVAPAYVGLTDGQGNPMYDYMVDSRPVVIKATKGRVIRHRPFIAAGWRAKFEIKVGDDGIPVEVVQSALATAGEAHGVADYRPRFGHFRIVSFDRIA
jgi:hypothetical protein